MDISQGGTVDLFRFWLQGYEDTDPAKAAQYARWRAPRETQERGEGNSQLRIEPYKGHRSNSDLAHFSASNPTAWHAVNIS